MDFPQPTGMWMYREILQIFFKKIFEGQETVKRSKGLTWLEVQEHKQKQLFTFYFLATFYHNRIREVDGVLYVIFSCYENSLQWKKFKD